MSEEKNDGLNRNLVLGGGALMIVAMLVGWYLHSQRQADMQALVEQGQAQQQAISAELDAARQTVDRLESDIAGMNAKLQELQVELASQTEIAVALQTELQRYQSKQSSLDESLGQVSSENAELAARLESEREQQQQLQMQIDGVTEDIGRKESELARAGLAALRLTYQLALRQQEKLAMQSSIETLNREREAQALQFAALEQKLTSEREAEARHFAELEQRLRGELDESRVQVTQLKNRMTVIKLTSEVLFNSGSARIKPEGQKVLALIAESLNNYPDRAIGVEGHTDNVPLRDSSRFESNWELSAARALSAVTYLQNISRVHPGRLRVVGYGEYHPVAANDTAEGRQLNRRIEIRLWPPEGG